MHFDFFFLLGKHSLTSITDGFGLRMSIFLKGETLGVNDGAYNQEQEERKRQRKNNRPYVYQCQGLGFIYTMFLSKRFY